MDSKYLAEALLLTADYLEAQEKRAEAELGDYLTHLDSEGLAQLSDDIAKIAESQLAVNYVSGLIKTAQARQEATVATMTKAAAESPDVKSYILDMVNKAKGTASDIASTAGRHAATAGGYVRDNVNNPLIMGAVGGGTGAVLGGAKHMLGGGGYGGLTSDILRGGLAGAAVGAGGSAVYNAMQDRGAPDSTQVAELNKAIGDYNVDGSPLVTPESVVLGTGLGINAFDTALAKRSPGSAFAAANVRRYADRTEMLDNLQKWLAENEKTPGRDSVEAFSKLISQQAHPDDTRNIMQSLAKELSHETDGIPNGNTALQKLFNDNGLGSVGSGTSSMPIRADVDAVARALSSSRPSGVQLAPSNIADRSGLSSWLMKRMPRASKPVLSTVNNANAALARPRLRGRTGLLAGLGLLAGGYGARQLMDSSRPSVTPEALANIKDQLKTL